MGPSPQPSCPLPQSPPRPAVPSPTTRPLPAPHLPQVQPPLGPTPVPSPASPLSPPAPSSPCPAWPAWGGEQRQEATPALRPPHRAPFPSLFVDEQRLSAAARQLLQADCPGPLCVELQAYGQVRAHLRRYAEGNVTVWLGTEYTTYGLYGVIPQVGHRRAPALTPAPPSPAAGHVGPVRLGDGPVPPSRGGVGCAMAIPGAQGGRWLCPAVPPSLPLQEKLLESSYSPVMLAKAVKNAKEQELLRAAHVRASPVPAAPSRGGGRLGEVGCRCPPPLMPLGHLQVRDAVAVIQYLLWLEKTVPQGQVDEFSGAQHIDALRRSVLLPWPPRPTWCRAAGDPWHLLPYCLPAPSSTAMGPASSPSQPAGSMRHWPTTGMARPRSGPAAAVGSGRLEAGSRL